MHLSTEFEKTPNNELKTQENKKKKLTNCSVNGVYSLNMTGHDLDASLLRLPHLLVK